MRNMIWMLPDGYLRFQFYFRLVEFLSLSAVRALISLDIC
jgi:hypothetical protein